MPTSNVRILHPYVYSAFRIVSKVTYKHDSCCTTICKYLSKICFSWSEIDVSSLYAVAISWL